MRGALVRRARRELRTDKYYLKPPLPRGERRDFDALALKSRIDRIERTIVEIGQAAAEAADVDDDAPALATALLELAQQLGEVQSRLDKIEGGK
jgi:hypothetical protein